MKKIIITIGLFLMLSMTLASNDGDKIIYLTPIKETTLKIEDLIPITPKEATFEEIKDTINIEKLSPKCPKEADFEL